MMIPKIALVLLSMLPLDLCAEDSQLWEDGKITPEQPFKALVRGVIPGWGGDTVIIQEIGGQERYCLAMLHMGLFRYEIRSKEKFDEKKPMGATFISPGVEVERFSWSMGIWKMGRIFGEEDIVRKWYEESKPKSEQTGARQPAIAPDSKTEGSEKPIPESEGRSQ